MAAHEVVRPNARCHRGVDGCYSRQADTEPTSFRTLSLTGADRTRDTGAVTGESAEGGVTEPAPETAGSPGRAGLRALPDRWASAHGGRYLIGVLILFGALVRWRQYSVRRSLWLDEAMITDNLLTRTLRGLTHPLASHQGAPYGWMVGEKISLHLVGTNEYALRLPAFLAGILCLPLIWWVGTLCLNRGLVPLLVAALAVSPFLIRYSSETKQYGSDAFCVLLTVGVAMWVARRLDEGQALRAGVVWAAVGVPVVLFSHPGILAEASCCAVLVGYCLLLRRFRAGLWLVAASAVILLAIGFHYELALKNLSHDSALKAYWRGGNPPTPLSPHGYGTWLTRVLPAVLHNPLDIGPVWLVGPLILLGILGLWRQERISALLVVAPLLCQLLASSLGIFPMAGRLVIGYVPLLLILLVAAVQVVTSVRVLTIAFGVTVVAMLIPNAANAVQLTASPLHFEELRPVMQQVAKKVQPGDVMMVHYPALPAYRVYKKMGIPLRENGTLYTSKAATCAPVLGGVAKHLSGKRVWFLSSHTLSADPGDADRVRAILRANGTVEADVVRPGAEGMLVSLPASATNFQLREGSSLYCLRL